MNDYTYDPTAAAVAADPLNVIGAVNTVLTDRLLARFNAARSHGASDIFRAARDMNAINRHCAELAKIATRD